MVKFRDYMVDDVYNVEDGNTYTVYENAYAYKSDMGAYGSYIMADGSVYGVEDFDTLPQAWVFSNYTEEDVAEDSEHILTDWCHAICHWHTVEGRESARKFIVDWYREDW